ncbi:MAG: BREX-3 system phosphatase PglZ, partial [Deltaproteobacteria bacterium]|nr:BREX-3 system phosphatase PglZ [Deltaproteobacteria bacterium]
MSSWRDDILKEFTPKVARLTLVADPDGLLLEEGILEGIRERGFELIPFEDHVAFRYAYETKFRSRWDKGEQTDLPAPRPDIFYVYVIQCGDKSLYIGQTDNLQRRWKQHNKGEATWTAPRKPIELVHYEEFKTREEAVNRGKHLKTTNGRREIKKLIMKGRARQAGLVVALRSGASDLASLPYDLLQAGRRLSLNLGEIFPNLSYPVIAALDRGDLEALFDAQKRHTPGILGDNATKEFVLRHVFEIAPELIRKPSDLLRVLLRRHYRGQRIPTILDERFIQVLRQNDDFEGWPLDSIIPDRETFFAFLQERWPIFLERSAKKDGLEISENTEAFGLEFSGPLDLPFDHDDIRVYIDNLFLEGLLQAVSHERADSLSKTWLAIGIRIDEQADRTRRVNGLLDNIASAIPNEDARHDDWFHFAKTWAELMALVLELNAGLPEPAHQRIQS